MINKFLNDFGIEQQIFYADFSWDVLLKLMPKTPLFKEIAKFPKVKRDLALLVDKNTKFSDIKELAFKTERKLLKEVSIFDVYEGKNIPEGKKSYAVSFMIQDDFKTLKDKQIDKIMNKLIQIFDKELGAKVR